MIINGKEIAQKVEEALVKQVQSLKERLISPSMALIQIGEDKASTSYAKSIAREAQNSGIYLEYHNLPSETPQQELLSTIKKLNERKDINGIMVELPLPQHIDRDAIIEAISPEKDIDCFHPINIGRLLEGNARFIPATAQSIPETKRGSLQLSSGGVTSWESQQPCSSCRKMQQSPSATLIQKIYKALHKWQISLLSQLEGPR